MFQRIYKKINKSCFKLVSGLGYRSVHSLNKVCRKVVYGMENSIPVQMKQFLSHQLSHLTTVLHIHLAMATKPTQLHYTIITVIGIICFSIVKIEVPNKDSALCHC